MRGVLRLQHLLAERDFARVGDLGVHWHCLRGAGERVGAVLARALLEQADQTAVMLAILGAEDGVDARLSVLVASLLCQGVGCVHGFVQCLPLVLRERVSLGSLRLVLGRADLVVDAWNQKSRMLL